MTDIRQLRLLTRLAVHACTELPETLVADLVGGVAQSHVRGYPRELTPAVVGLTEVPERDALAIAVKHFRQQGVTLAFLRRDGVSDGAVEKMLAKDTRVTVWRQLADSSGLSVHGYEWLSRSPDIEVRASLLGNFATEAATALRLWTSEHGLTCAGRKANLHQLRNLAADAHFGLLGPDAIHALLAAEPHDAAAFMRAWSTADLFILWRRLHPGSHTQAATVLLRDLKDCPAPNHPTRGRLRELLRLIGADPELTALVRAYLPDPSTVLGRLAHPDASGPNPLPWAEAVSEGRLGPDGLAAWRTGLADALIDTCGQDPARWQVLYSLSPEFTGTAQQLMEIVAGISD